MSKSYIPAESASAAEMAEWGRSGPQTHHHSLGRALPEDEPPKRVVVLDPAKPVPSTSDVVVFDVSGPNPRVIDSLDGAAKIIDSFAVVDDPGAPAAVELQHVASRRHDPKPRVQPLLPADRAVASEGDLVIFDDDDVRSVLEAYKAAALKGGPLEAMRAAMMLTMQVAAINLDIH